MRDLLAGTLLILAGILITVAAAVGLSAEENMAAGIVLTVVAMVMLAVVVYLVFVRPGDQNDRRWTSYAAAVFAVTMIVTGIELCAIGSIDNLAWPIVGWILIAAFVLVLMFYPKWASPEASKCCSCDPEAAEQNYSGV